MSKIIKTFVVSMIVVWTFGPANTMTARTSYADEEVTSQPQTANQAVIKDPLDLWLDRLSFQESSNREGIQIIDTNGHWSRGCLQFQDATLHSYARLYGMPVQFMQGSSSRIATCDYQKALARRIIQDGGWKNWFTSVKKIGPPPTNAQSLNLKSPKVSGLPRA